MIIKAHLISKRLGIWKITEKIWILEKIHLHFFISTHILMLANSPKQLKDIIQDPNIVKTQLKKKNCAKTMSDG